MEHLLTLRMIRLRPETDADIPLPRYMTPQSSGMDICAAVPTPVVLKPQDIQLIPTGFAVAIPSGFEGQVRPRSGLAVKYGISIINSPATIDSDYRGELMIPLVNFGKNNYTIHRGDRIAQMVIQKVYQARLEIAERLDETERNCGGFGHTGI